MATAEGLRPTREIPPPTPLHKPPIPWGSRHPTIHHIMEPRHLPKRGPDPPNRALQIRHARLEIPRGPAHRVDAPLHIRNPRLLARSSRRRLRMLPLRPGNDVARGRLAPGLLTGFGIRHKSRQEHTSHTHKYCELNKAKPHTYAPGLVLGGPARPHQTAE